MKNIVKNKRLVILVVFLCLSTFYLLSSSYNSSQSTQSTIHDDDISVVDDEQQEQEEIDSNVIPVLYPNTFEYYTPANFSEEKLITYLPHSGFHNQRIELENALLLASYLNRTLLLPSVYLGNPAFPWLRFDKMYERLLLQTKQGLEYCSKLRQGEPTPSECLNYPRWTTVPWTFFYDLKQLNKKVRIIFRNDLSLEWIQETFDMTEDDIYLFKDVSPFDFRVYDLPESKTPLARFVNRVEISTLEAIKERVIHFGSVFGTYRVLAQSPENLDLLKFIRQEMIFKNPILIETANQVVNALGGKNNFVGIHLRVGDGLFKVRASITIDDIYHQLVNQYTDLTVEELKEVYDTNHDEDRKENLAYEIKQLREKVDYGESNQPIRVEHPPDISNRLGVSNLLDCRQPDGRNDRFSKTTIFIATDCPNPREHPLLSKIFKTFPCTFVLSDFKHHLVELSKITVTKEKINLSSYLIPMIDAIISSQGHDFYGTNASTFSTYIERQLHPMYTFGQIEIVGAPQP